ncbi:unnamed protein product [Soboliphyme baturini]|uniref:Myosin motor domain-containing protein n=1 Tax=Soboliphyme baturini TaxID=241478 RepID=A0A183IZZ1_9BILA|nr:unnamed protein product [Soboliphyme baturini]
MNITLQLNADSLPHRSNKNQSVVITGESGSGKTVSAKHVMRYLAHACSGAVKSRRNRSDVEDKVLASNPILEAFGNAATIRNDNSSRFGKFVQIMFADEYFITGAFIETYLLERSRVVYQAQDERNYHIFYQLCAARNKEPMLEKLQLRKLQRCWWSVRFIAVPVVVPSADFYYLNQGRKSSNGVADDLMIFHETHEAFLQLGFEKDTMRQIYVVLAAILHLGNVAFTESSSTPDVADIRPDSVQNLEMFSTLLKIDNVKLNHWLCNRLLHAGGEKLTKGLTIEEAKAARDATSKHIYASLFVWIVQQINNCLTAGTNKTLQRNIGILDIYGFEIFDENSFEQLCVNYANEILQQQFNQHVFKLEQEEYVREGLEWSFISFVDNQPCLDLLEGRLGIFDLLDQECRVGRTHEVTPTAFLCKWQNFQLTTCNDENWLNIMINSKTCNRSEHFSFPLVRSQQKNFIVRHYASPVTYLVSGFTAKNLDTINLEHINLLKSSKLPLISQILLDDCAKVRPKSEVSKSRNLKHTVAFQVRLVFRYPASYIGIRLSSFQFRQSLRDLKKILDSTMPHYVRCIKPNDHKLSLTYQIRRASEQLNACGVLETIRISAAGYPSRFAKLSYTL